ncbi:hypothetical protein AO501_03050 [Mycobacterium gordonae]|uniref:Uncharacterized protein n=1 Tax=Mycobacterium gordonae TaxID=1778 RepID=A0A0Q2MER6_MYCGO|nr:hypothetical protein AO501_03050 [Mycobacterium gordonae]
MTREERSVSPDGRYVLYADSFEARAFQWVDTPELLDATTGSTVLKLTDDCWHLDSASWRSRSVLEMRLRHFPDGVPCYSVLVDCGQLTASVDGVEARPLDQVDGLLRDALAAQ